MAKPKALITGSSGLIGSEVVRYLAAEGFAVFGIDNNMRADFFGREGDTLWNLAQLQSELGESFRHHDVDIRDREGVMDLIRHVRPALIVHAAAQPSHDLAAQRPFDDFDTNAVGTFNLLEATRQHVHDSVFVYLSTNKVYGDAPNEIPLVELATRWAYDDADFADGIPESLRIDQCKHSLFGASKLAADVAVQEYGRYFGMKTCCLRGGCLTGPNHSGVQLHGFLSYLVRCNVMERKYTVFGYKGKQVRDNIHSYDVARFVHAFYDRPRSGEVYNLGGGSSNSCSILEAFKMAEAQSGKEMQWEYVDDARVGDHICYISSLAKIRSHYPEWSLSRSLSDIFAELYQGWCHRLVS